MKWAHLPNAGGLYDQDPELLDKFEYIFGEIAKHEKSEQEKRDKEQRDAKARKMRSGPRPIRVRNR